MRILGQRGNEQQNQTLGELPSYMQGDIRLGHLPGVFGPVDAGRTPVLQTHSLNPFNTAADLGELAAALVHGKAGAHSDLLASGPNPLLQGIIKPMTGRSLPTAG